MGGGVSRMQTTAIHRQLMQPDMGLDWFRWAISYVGGSQVLRRGVLGDAQMPFKAATD
jgi:hypothetical protein